MAATDTRRRWYEKDREAQIERVQRRKKQLRVWLSSYKATLSCQQCGEDHPATLDFHHRDPATKDASIYEAIERRGWGKERILREIDKCDVLCSNCHRKTHWKS